MEILFIEGNGLQRVLSVSHLRKQGHTVDAFFSESETNDWLDPSKVGTLIEKVQHGGYDCIILDRETCTEVGTPYETVVKQVRDRGYRGRLVGTTTMSQWSIRDIYHSVPEIKNMPWLCKPFGFEDLDEIFS